MRIPSRLICNKRDRRCIPMKHLKFTALILALLLALSLCVCAGAESTLAPDFTVIDADGKKVSLSDKLDGKPLIFNIWASWCPPCVEELPHFDEAAKEYKDKITFMMINLTDGEYETVAGAQEFIRQNGLTFPLYFDTNGEAADIYLGEYIPMTWFINADGTVLGYIEGGMDRDTLYSCIAMLLES